MLNIAIDGSVSLYNRLKIFFSAKVLPMFLACVIRDFKWFWLNGLDFDEKVGF